MHHVASIASMRNSNAVDKGAPEDCCLDHPQGMAYPITILMIPVCGERMMMTSSTTTTMTMTSTSTIMETTASLITMMNMTAIPTSHVAATTDSVLVAATKLIVDMLLAHLLLHVEEVIMEACICLVDMGMAIHLQPILGIMGSFYKGMVMTRVIFLGKGFFG